MKLLGLTTPGTSDSFIHCHSSLPLVYRLSLPASKLMVRAFIISIFMVILAAGCTTSADSTIPDSQPTVSPTSTLASLSLAGTPSSPGNATEAPKPPEGPLETGDELQIFPEAPLSDKGPWLAYYDSMGVQIAAINQDGTGLTFLDSPFPNSVVGSLVASPGQGRFAYIEDRSLDARTRILDLIIVELPEGEIFDRIPLIEPNWHEKALPAGYDDREIYLDNVMQSLTTEGSIAWSPDGRYLAYVGAIQGPSGDVYVYDTIDRTSRVLTTGAGQAAALSWSPNSEWIAHLALEDFGDEFGWNVLGLWLVSPTGEGLQNVLDDGEMIFVKKWLGDETFIASGWDLAYGPEDLWTVSIAEQDRSRFFTGPLMMHAFDSDGSVVALYINDFGADFYDLKSGLYVQPRFGGTPIEVLANVEPLSIEYSQEHDLFVAGLPDQTVLLSRQGEIELSLSVGGLANFSPDGKWLLISGDSANLYSFEDDFVIPLWDEPIRAQTWGRDSLGVFLFLDDSRDLIYMRVPAGDPYLLSRIDSPFFESFVWIGE